MMTFSGLKFTLVFLLFLLNFTTVFGISDEILEQIREECEKEELDPEEYKLNLHIAALFVILFTSSSGAFVPVIVKRYPNLRIPKVAFFAAKHFGTGVILATAFIHIMPSAFFSLTSYCLDPTWWDTYPSFAGAFAMAAALGIFFIEYVATTMTKDHEGHTHALVLPTKSEEGSTKSADGELSGGEIVILSTKAQSLGIIILEAGICFHSVIIGMDLGVSTGTEFTSLWIALIFHQMFEGLGLGSRIAELYDPKTLKPWLLSLAYGTTTPLGIAIGIGIRFSYNANSSTSLAVQGILDSVSAGILIYTSLVQLIASDFIVNPQFRKESTKTQVSAFTLLLIGVFIMSLIGKWA
jgi:zinc transporter 1/2/3